MARMNSTHPSITVTYFFMTDERSADRTLQPEAPAASLSASQKRRVKWVVAAGA